jgi:tRNA threonylcarbamoyladenosine biosynthesis protein TsaB
MRILAIETSGQRGSIAVLNGEGDAATVVGQTMLTGERRTAQSLAPALQSLLADAAWQPDSIGLVAVAVGPGSFTGLRIGVTTAKTFAYAINAEVVGVNSLAILAQQAPRAEGPLWTIMDAQRGELFAACYHPSADGKSTIAHDTSILAQDAWLAELRPGHRVTGPATPRVHAKLPRNVVVVPEPCWQPTAAAAGYVGWQAYRAGHRDDIWQLVPNYYRQSAAEEKARSREQGAGRSEE